MRLSVEIMQLRHDLKMSQRRLMTIMKNQDMDIPRDSVRRSSPDSSDDPQTSTESEIGEDS